MTEKESKEFFDIVKGKKIFWEYWKILPSCDILYVIPIRRSNGAMICNTYRRNYDVIKEDIWTISNGFKPFSAFTEKWVLLEPLTIVDKALILLNKRKNL